MNAWQILAAPVLGMLASNACAVPLAASGFDAGAQGWFAVNGAHSFDWQGSGGAPGGHVQAKDFDGQTLWFFAAPADYLGDKLTAYGGSLSFALKSDSSSLALVTPYADIHLLGQNGVRLVYAGSLLPGSDWTRYNIALVADGAWHVDSISGAAATAADFEGVLSDLRQLRIRGDYRQAVETTGLDAVVLSSAAAVPEPVTAWLWLAGLAVVAGTARRRT